MKTLFRNPEGAFIALSTGRSAELLRGLLPYAEPETLVGGITKKGEAWARFVLRQDLPYETFTLRVIFFGRLYTITIQALNLNGIWVLDDEEVVPFANNALVHGFGIGANGKPVGFPSFYKRLGEVPNCRRCPFWVKGDVGDEQECARFGWQPAGLHYLNEPQCSAAERQQQGMKILKVFDRYGSGTSILGAAVMRRIDEVRNAPATVKTAPVQEVEPEVRRTRQALKLSLSEYVLEMDSKLADAGCQVPLFDVADATLRQLLEGCDSLAEAAAVVNQVGGIPTPDQFEQVLAEVRDTSFEMDSLDWALDHDLV